jgi:hypothetical protein
MAVGRVAPPAKEARTHGIIEQLFLIQGVLLHEPNSKTAMPSRR